MSLGLYVTDASLVVTGLFRYSQVENINFSVLYVSQ